MCHGQTTIYIARDGYGPLVGILGNQRKDSHSGRSLDHGYCVALVAARRSSTQNMLEAGGVDSGVQGIFLRARCHRKRFKGLRQIAFA